MTSVTSFGHVGLTEVVFETFCNFFSSRTIGETRIPPVANFIVHHKLVCTSKILVGVYYLGKSSGKGLVLLRQYSI